MRVSSVVTSLIWYNSGCLLTRVMTSLITMRFSEYQPEQGDKVATFIHGSCTCRRIPRVMLLLHVLHLLFGLIYFKFIIRDFTICLDESIQLKNS